MLCTTGGWESWVQSLEARVTKGRGVGLGLSSPNKRRTTRLITGGGSSATSVKHGESESSVGTTSKGEEGVRHSRISMGFGVSLVWLISRSGSNKRSRDLKWIPLLSLHRAVGWCDEEPVCGAYPRNLHAIACLPSLSRLSAPLIAYTVDPKVRNREESGDTPWRWKKGLTLRLADGTLLLIHVACWVAYGQSERGSLDASRRVRATEFKRQIPDSAAPFCWWR